MVKSTPTRYVLDVLIDDHWRMQQLLEELREPATDGRARDLADVQHRVPRAPRALHQPVHLSLHLPKQHCRLADLYDARHLIARHAVHATAPCHF
jgi:hypothetical protein